MQPDVPGTASSLTVVVAIFAARVWTLDSSFVDTLRRRFPSVTFIEARTHEALEAALPLADIAFSSVVRERHFAHAHKLRWIHSSAAGVGALLFPSLVESGVVVTNSRGVQSSSIAEHILAAVFAWRRGLHTAMRRQVRREWAQDELSAVRPARLADTRALVVGMGSIGRQAAAMLDALGLPVTGVGRRAREGQAGIDSLPALLPS
ncbi:MAG: hypothetical protein M3R55_05895, partial [Acidobacteriota bacterium]|nr:hypothetical protein [Acidobacteriota bacterium]